MFSLNSPAANGLRRRLGRLAFRLVTRDKGSLDGFVADDIASKQQATLGIVNKIGTMIFLRRARNASGLTIAPVPETHCKGYYELRAIWIV